MYLYRSAMNYARLLGKELAVDARQRDFTLLVDALNALLPRGQELRLEVRQQGLHLRVIDDLETNTLYYLPCKILDQTEGEFRQIILAFFRMLHTTQRLTPLTGIRYFEYLQEEVDQYADGMNEEAETEWTTLMKSYTEGAVSLTLNRIQEPPGCTAAELALRTRAYIPAGPAEQEILEQIAAGLVLLATGKALLNHTNAPRGCGEEWPVGAEHLFLIIYDDDRVSENLIEYMNAEAQECGYEFFSSVDSRLSPRTKRPARPDGFVPRFIQWLNAFSYVLYNR